MRKFRRSYIIALGLLLGTLSCTDLSVENLNDPDLDRVLSNETEVQNLAASLYSNWYTLTYGYSSSEGSPVHAFAVASDNNSCSWGNVGMRDTSSEPREAWNNSPLYTYEYISSSFFENMHQAATNASDVIKSLHAGIIEGEQEVMLLAWARFNQALALSNIALTFDQGYVITETSTEEEITSPQLRSSDEIAAQATVFFDEAISISSEYAFSLPSGYINGVNADNILLNQLANTYAARLLTYMPRTHEENGFVDWVKVKAYAEQGITNDFMILMDDIVWVNDYKWTVAYPGWGRMDMRVANLMYPETIEGGYPAHNPDGLDFPRPDSTLVIDTEEVDDRIITDFEVLSINCGFRGCEYENGYYFSNFRSSRYDEYINLWNTFLPELYKAELDMILAEAELELGNLSEAAAILNNPNNTRKARGGLPDVMVEVSSIREAISHERHVELTITSFGLQFFDMRKQDLLQYGTFLELPLPGKIQEYLQMETPYYTFGGDNLSSSQGGWR